MLLIILIGAGQVLVNLLLDRARVGFLKPIVYLLLVTAYLFYIPRFFVPEPGPDGINCGMPVLAIMVAIWTLGVGASTLIHLVYVAIGILRSLRRKKA